MEVALRLVKLLLVEIGRTYVGVVHRHPFEVVFPDFYLQGFLVSLDRFVGFVHGAVDDANAIKRRSNVAGDGLCIAAHVILGELQRLIVVLDCLLIDTRAAEIGTQLVEQRCDEHGIVEFVGDL